MRSKFKSLLLLSLFCFLVSPVAGFAAEEILRISRSNLVHKIDNLAPDLKPNQILDEYYALVSSNQQAEYAELRDFMNRRSEAYQIAFRSGDTAEMNENLDDLAFFWASIRTLHAQMFAPEAIEELESTYARIYFFIRER